MTNIHKILGGVDLRPRNKGLDFGVICMLISFMNIIISLPICIFNDVID